MMSPVADKAPLMATITRRTLSQKLLVILFLILVVIFISFSSRNNFDDIRVQGSRNLYLKNELQKDPGSSFIKNTEDDAHIKLLDNINLGSKRNIYPKRQNMGECPPLFGKVIVFVAVVESSYKTHYRVAQQSLNCYLKSVNYTFALVDLDNDEKVNKHCKHDQVRITFVID